MTQLATVLGVATVYIGLWLMDSNTEWYTQKLSSQEKSFTYFATCFHW